MFCRLISTDAEALYNGLCMLEKRTATAGANTIGTTTVHFRRRRIAQ
jgi:hypothetical protein